MPRTTHVAPRDLNLILLHATQEDIPSGFTVEEVDRLDTTVKRIRYGGQEIARIHRHRGHTNAKCCVPFELRDQEPRIYEMLRRIARTVNDRLGTSVRDAAQALKNLNLD